METLSAGALARVLEAGRPRYNAWFAQARRQRPGLDADAFAAHLREVTAPIVDAVAVVAADRLAEVVDVLYEFALDLVGKNFPGRHPALLDGWATLLRTQPRHLAAAPRRFAGSVANALYHLTTNGARVGDWVAAVGQLGALTDDQEALLEAGKVCAWRCGLAHFRAGALEAGAQLAPALAAPALGLPAAVDPPTLAAALARLRADPWLSPAAALNDAPARQRLEVVATVGGFRGFGGPFLAPPTVGCGADQLFAHDGAACWQLTADSFGATWHRADGMPTAENDASPFGLAVDGTVKHGRLSHRFEELQEASSSAATSATLAVTLPLSHFITLLAVVQEA